MVEQYVADIWDIDDRFGDCGCHQRVADESEIAAIHPDSGRPHLRFRTFDQLDIFLFLFPVRIRKRLRNVHAGLFRTAFPQPQLGSGRRHSAGNLVDLLFEFQSILKAWIRCSMLSFHRGEPRRKRCRSSSLICSAMLEALSLPDG